MTSELVRPSKGRKRLVWDNIRSGFTFLLAAAFVDCAKATENLPSSLSSIGTATVSSVVDGDTVVLDDGRQVRLTGIQAPKLPLDRPNFPTWPLAPEAKATLETLLLGRTVTLRSGGADRDRHGRVLAHPVTEPGGVWAQGAMVEAGMARVYTFADNYALAGALYARERAARAAGRGIWALPWYRIRTPHEAADDIGTFQLVEGTVVDAARAGKTVYLNFGDSWRTDFTISIPVAVMTNFAAQKRDPLAWAGKRVRVRGWLTERNGPMITITHPEALEGPLTEPRVGPGVGDCEDGSESCMEDRPPGRPRGDSSSPQSPAFRNPDAPFFR